MRPDLAYALGMLVTDGHVQTKHRDVLAWQLADREPLEIIRDAFDSTKEIETCKRAHGTYFRLRLCGKRYIEQIAEYGITWTSQVPKLPVDALPHFLRGVLDGDGSVKLERGSKVNRPGYLRLRVTIASGSNEFLHALRDLIGFGRVNEVSGPVGHRAGTLSFDCSEAIRFLRFVYADSDGIRLTRKYDRWQEFLASGQSYRTEVVV